MNSPRADITPWKTIAIVGAIFFAGCFIGSIVSKAYFPALGFALFLILPAVLFSAYGPVEVGEHEITMITPVGCHAIRWDEVRRIERGQSHLIFMGENKRLTVPHPTFWSGSGKKSVLAVIEAFIQTSGIRPTVSLTTDFKLSANAKKQP